MTRRNRKGGKVIQRFRRIVPKASRTVLVEPRQRCPKARRGSRAEADEAGREDGHRPRLHEERLQEDGHEVRRDQEPLSEVRRALQPAARFRIGIRTPSDTGFQAWTIYQRVVLRLPYDIIAQVMDHLFGIGLSTSTLVNFRGIPRRTTTPRPRRPSSRRS